MHFTLYSRGKQNHFRARNYEKGFPNSCFIFFWNDKSFRRIVVVEIRITTFLLAESWVRYLLQSLKKLLILVWSPTFHGSHFNRSLTFKADATREFLSVMLTSCQLNSKQSFNGANSDLWKHFRICEIDSEGARSQTFPITMVFLFFVNFFLSENRLSHWTRASISDSVLQTHCIYVENCSRELRSEFAETIFLILQNWYSGMRYSEISKSLGLMLNNHSLL